MKRNTVLLSRMPVPLHAAYYRNQIGSGYSDVFRGREYQRGHGIGNIFSGLFRIARPFLVKGAKAVGKQAMRTGIQVLDDISKGNRAKESLKARMLEGGRNLAGMAGRQLEEMQSGGGYKSKKAKKTVISKRVVKKATSQKGKGKRKSSSKRNKRGKLAASFRPSLCNKVPKRGRKKFAYKDIF